MKLIGEIFDTNSWGTVTFNRIYANGSTMKVTLDKHAFAILRWKEKIAKIIGDDNYAKIENFIGAIESEAWAKGSDDTRGDW